MDKTSKNQVLLTVPESMILVMGADADKFLTIDAPNKNSLLSDDPEFRKKYGDILNSILLSGTATVCGPSYLKNDAAYERLASEGILQIVEQDHSKNLRSQLSKHYEKAFTGYRELETHPNFSSKLYIDDIIDDNKWKPFSDIDLEEKKGDLEFHEYRLHNALSSATDSLRGLFGHHFDANRSFYSSLISNIVGDRIPDTTYYDIQSLVGAGPSTNSIFEIMGLEIRSAELQESDIPLFSFMPDDLSEFREKDNSLFDFSGGFENFAKLGMDFGLRLNHSDYVLVHSFWKAFFEMTDLLHFSENNSCPIYMPVDIPVNNVAEKQSAALNEDLRRIYKMYISERGFTPRIDCIEDLLRLREDKRLAPLREVLCIWEEELSKENVDGMNFVKKEIEKARKEVKKLTKYSAVGQYIGYASLPMSAVDLAIGTPIGLALAPIGAGLDFFSKQQLKKFNWLNFGT